MMKLAETAYSRGHMIQALRYARLAASELMETPNDFIIEVARNRVEKCKLAEAIEWLGIMKNRSDEAEHLLNRVKSVDETLSCRDKARSG